MIDVGLFPVSVPLEPSIFIYLTDRSFFSRYMRAGLAETLNSVDLLRNGRQVIVCLKDNQIMSTSLRVVEERTVQQVPWPFLVSIMPIWTADQVSLWQVL